MQRMRSKSNKIAINAELLSWKYAYWLEMHEIWHENTLGNKYLEYWKKMNFNKVNSRYSS